MLTIRCAALALALSCIAAIAYADDQPPNIVLVMADDLGFSDIGCYGSEIETPNLDRLAAGGLRYLGFHNTSRCCPSRAALMTGKYAHRVQMGWMTAVDEHRDGYRGQLSFEHPTIAELLKRAGYRTCMSGKWHLTVDPNHRNPKAIPNGSWPTQRGFDEFYGGLTGGGSFYRPSSLARNLTRIPKDSLPEDYYYTHQITKHAVEFVEDSPLDQPLFLYVAHYAPHRPLQAPSDRVDRCRERYAAGYDELRLRRFAKQKQLGFYDEKLPLGEPGLRLPYKAPAWKELNTKQQKRWIEEMATYAAMVEIMDDGIGEVVAALQSRDQLDNTVFLFLSDNGGTKEGGLLAQLRGDLCNTPYRTYKQFTHLGGVASPLIVHWPAKLNDAGAIRTCNAHIIDLVPTCLDAAGVAYPERFDGQPVVPPDGISLVDTFADRPLPDRALYWEHQSSRAILRDQWRLVSLHSDDPWELYNLDEDPFEQRNLANSQPTLAAQLAEQWHQWAETIDVLPLENKPWNDRINYYRKQAELNK